MLTPRMLGFLQHRLAANAPQQSGSHEYLAGVDDALASVRRLMDVSEADTSTVTWLPEAPGRTALAAEYLQLETSSLVWLLDSMLQRPSSTHPDDEGMTSEALREARNHLVRARAALGQARGSRVE